VILRPPLCNAPGHIAGLRAGLIADVTADVIADVMPDFSRPMACLLSLIAVSLSSAD
jgi:hypothetical protein